MIITSISNAPVTSPNVRVTAAAELLEILHEGSRRAQKIARQTMDEVRDAVRLEP